MPLLGQSLSAERSGPRRTLRPRQDLLRTGQSLDCVESRLLILNGGCELDGSWSRSSPLSVAHVGGTLLAREDALNTTILQLSAWDSGTAKSADEPARSGAGSPSG
ncbi:hypothetical protein HJFPF1_12654 [Paramyrothecium foliicola]|nr:hypothetical protein HJFPF1_12654 [Paramyrothecium foliicola]